MQALSELTAHHAEFFIFCFALLGLIVGSFLNVAIYRLPIMLEREWQLAIENAEGNEIDVLAEKLKQSGKVRADIAEKLLAEIRK